MVWCSSFCFQWISSGVLIQNEQNFQVCYLSNTATSVPLIYYVYWLLGLHWGNTNKDICFFLFCFLQGMREMQRKIWHSNSSEKSQFKKSNYKGENKATATLKLLAPSRPDILNFVEGIVTKPEGLLTNNRFTYNRLTNNRLTNNKFNSWWISEKIDNKTVLSWLKNQLARCIIYKCLTDSVTLAFISNFNFYHPHFLQNLNN